MWSVRDKKVVEGLIQTFNEQNQRLQDNVKLWCLANQLGVDPEHLRRLESDESSKKLGFDVDARLRLMKKAPGEVGSSLELPKEPCNGQHYIQENHEYETPAWWMNQCSGHVTSVDPTTKARVESLARLLHQPKERIFRIPHCLGWHYIQRRSQGHAISFVFEAAHEPISLLELLSSTTKGKDANPELGDKFRLAGGLAICLTQLHMVGWLHESFRSENVLFFPTSDPNTNSPTIDFTSPSVLGFDFSRDDVSRSTFRADFEPSRDVYRHPQRQGSPEKAFTRLHDIYALGVVLLEIGLWKPAVTLQEDNFRKATIHDRYEVSKQLLNHAEHRLGRRVGQKYKDVVIKCLKGDFGVKDDSKEDLKLQQAFRAQVVDVLERAADAL